MKKATTVYSSKAKIVFELQDSGIYEPIIYDAELDKATGKWKGKRIMKGDIFHNFIAYVRYSSAIIDKRTGKMKNGWLELYQYHIAFEIIKSSMNLKNEHITVAISRQAGKTHVVRVVLAFLVIFLPNHVYIKENRYYLIFTAVKEALLVDQMGKLSPEIDKAVDLFNKMFPDNKIITSNEDRTLMATKLKKEFNRWVNGKNIPYSSVDGIAVGNGQVNAGYTAHVLFSDECQEINEEEFNIQVAPFVNRTGGVSVGIGTTLPTGGNLLYGMFNDPNIPDSRKIRYTWEDVYACKKHSDEQAASDYKNSAMQMINKFGMNSDIVKTQLYVSFNIKGNRYITYENMKELNLFMCDILTSLKSLGRMNKNSFRVGGFDSATTNDYCVLTTGNGEIFADGKIKNQLNNVYIFNKQAEKLSPEKMINILCTYCMDNEIDMLMIDSTANQEDRVFWAYKIFKSRGCNTLLIPFSFSNKNKQLMMEYLNDSMHGKMLELPSEDYMNIYDDYKELIEELCYLEVTEGANGSLKYAAPVGSSYFDDCVMSLAMLNYLLFYVRKEYKKGKIINLGDGIEYFLRFHKYSDRLLVPKKKERLKRYNE